MYCLIGNLMETMSKDSLEACKVGDTMFMVSSKSHISLQEMFVK